MKCLNCDYEIKENWKCCPKCGKELNNLNSINPLTTDDKIVQSKNEKKVIFAFLLFSILPILMYRILFFLDIINLGSYKGSIKLLDLLYPLFNIAAIITIIYGKIKYPNNKIISIIFGVLIALIIISILWVVLFYLTCFTVIRN